jgi:hypothetical protein
MSEDIEWVGINDNQEKMVKKESLYFFKNKWGDYLAIFKDHIEIKVSNKKNEWQDFEAYIPLQGTTVKIHAGDASHHKQHFGDGNVYLIFAYDGNYNSEEWIHFEDKEKGNYIRKLILQTKTKYEKVEQTIVQGDKITKTEIKDSVLNRSNVGGGSSKMQELEKLAEMKEKGLIDDGEFKQMKKEILGK